ncbi:MAG: hypothetical protein HY828_16810 [Actinobacteria bacterium]|nr:hypothetical protein [Actinomycetota bacterium]
MRLTKLTRVGVFVACLGLSGGLVAAASGATGAYFSDSEAGTFSGTLGSIKIEGSGGTGANGLDFEFEHILPGETRTATATFANTGLSPQDVWITFPNTPQFQMLNQLGSFGAVEVKANSDTIFYSANLNSNFACGTPGIPPQPTICALPNKLKLFGNVAPGGTGTFSFSFTLGSAFTTQPDPIPVVPGLDYLLVGTQVGIQP